MPIPPLSQTLRSYIENNPDDDAIVALFKKVRALQSNGVQIRQAIQQACNSDTKKIRVQLKNLHVDNVPAYLAVRHRAKLRKFRSEGHGYGKIAKLLAQRNVYNKETKKPYSRSTIKRAIQLLEQGNRHDD